MTTKQIQWQLWILDLYDSYIDGIAGPLTRSGLEEFYERYGADELTFEPKSMTLIKAIQHKVGTEEDGLGGCFTRSGIIELQDKNGLNKSGKWDEDIANFYPEVLNDVDLDNIAPTAPESLKPKFSSQLAQIGKGLYGSKYFTREEFRCQCGGKYCNGFPVEPTKELISTLDKIRERLGVPITIVESGGSGVRCVRHNAEVGGVSNSEHLYGRAADLHSSVSPAAMKTAAEAVMGKTGGIGLYNWGIHVDVGKYSRWDNR